MRSFRMLAVLALALAHAPAADAQLRVLGLEGQPVPGTAGVLGSVQQPLLNGAREVVFLARITGDPAFEGFVDNGVFFADAGGLRLVARTFDPAAGALPSERFLSFGVPSLDDTGQVVFEARLDPDSPGVEAANDEGIWRTDLAGNLELLAREGDPAPGLPGEVFRDFDPPALGAAGHVVFTDLGRRGIWGATPGQPLQPLVLAGDPAPGGGTFSGFAFVSRVNAAGDFAWAGFTDQPVTGVWSRTGAGMLRKDLQTGPAAGVPGAAIITIDALDINEAGDVAVGVDVMPSPLGPWPDPAGYVSEASSGLRLVATAGMEIEGQGAAQFDIAGYYPLVDDSGRVSLFGTALIGSEGVTDENDEAIWRLSASGAVEVLAREGDPTPRGSLFYKFLDIPVINGAGDVAFLSQVRPAGGPPTMRALVRARDGEAPEALVLPGDLVEVGPGDLRAVDHVQRLLPYTLERRDALMNELGDVAVLVTLEGTTAVAVAVPEPAQGLLLLTGSLALWLGGARRAAGRFR